MHTPRLLSLSHTSLSLCDFFLVPQEIMFIETSAKEGFNIKLLFRRLATALPNLESSAAPAPDPQVVDLSAPPPTAAATAAQGGGCMAGCY